LEVGKEAFLEGRNTRYCTSVCRTGRFYGFGGI